MYRNFLEVTVAEHFDDDIGTTMFVGLIKIGDREVWRGSTKFDMETAYTQAEAALAHALRGLVEEALKNV